MAYVLPTFNVTVNIWRPSSPLWGAPDVVSLGNLAFGRRVNIPTGNEQGVIPAYGSVMLLLPAKTDIRDDKAVAGYDTVEVPAGSQRFYVVAYVDEIGLAFANEHRCAILQPFPPWPTPFPGGTGPFPPPLVAPLAQLASFNGNWLTGHPPVTWPASSYTDVLVHLFNPPSVSPVTVGGNMPLSGSSTALPAANLVSGVWWFSGASGGGSKTVTISGAPPSLNLAWIVYGLQGPFTTLVSDLWGSGTGANPSHTPSGWSGPPTVPKFMIPLLAMTGTVAGSQTFNLPYFNILAGLVAGGSAIPVYEASAIRTPPSLVYTPFTFSESNSNPYAIGTIMAG